MKSFIQHHSQSITHTLSGFDRMRFRGCISLFTNGGGLDYYLTHIGQPFGEAVSYFSEITDAIKESGRTIATEAGRRLKYLESPSTSKERTARKISKEEGIKDGLICVLTCVEPCWTYRFSRVEGKIDWRPASRQCLHQYFYMHHPEFGFCHVRVQTWCPFTVTICINGREWLSRQMDKTGIDYVRRENCFLAISDPVKAQRLCNSQANRNWEVLLNQLCRKYHPAWKCLAIDSRPLDYYWTAMETEWATDIVFRSRRSLDKIYGDLVRYGLLHFDSANVMRFLGQKTPSHGEVHGQFKEEVFSDCRRRPEGIRLRHWVGKNSVKTYNKQHRVLRVETTINAPYLFKAKRRKVTEPNGPKQLLRVLKSVASMPARAKVSQGCNARYLEGLSAAPTCQATLNKLLSPIAKRTSLDGRPARGLRFFEQGDMDLLKAVGDAKFCMHGFRNRDIRELLSGENVEQTKNFVGQVTRKLLLLRAHQLIEKIPGTHRYRLTRKGTQVTSALTAAKATTIEQLHAIAL